MIPLESFIKKHTKTPVLFSPELKKVIIQYCGEVFDEGKLAAMASYQNHLGFNREQIEEKTINTKKNMTATQPTTVRDRRFDGSIRKNGLSKLMRDIFVLPEKKKNMEEEKIDLENGYVNIAKIIEQTAYELGVDVEQIKGRSRSRKFVTARSIICFIARYTTTLSLKQIGTEISMYSPKDHSSVIHATQKAFDFIHNPDTEFIVLFERVRQRLDAHYNITFDLEDLTHMPSWYKNMLKDK